jgi:diketogulonate reductase-like aldo/keto reductase
MIDTAQAPEWYREDLVGEALAESEIERKELFVTTKIHPRHLGRKGMDMIASSLKNLRTEYIDLVLLHYSECWGNLCSQGEVVPGTWKEAYRELERLVEEFKVVRFIGVSNFNTNNLEELHAFAKVKPYSVQTRSDLFAQDRRTMDVCAKYGWRFEAYSSLGGQWWQYKTNPVLNNDVVKSIAARYNVSPAMVVLNYAKNVLHQTVIPRSRDRKHMEDSLLRLDSFALDNEEIESLRALDGKIPPRD